MLYDPSDPFGLKRVIGQNIFGIPIPGDDPDPLPIPGGGDDIIQGGPRKTHPEGIEGGKQMADLLKSISGGWPGAAAAAPTKSSTKLVGAKAGSPNYFGIGDLVSNVAFQRLWEGYNPGKRVDAPGFDFLGALTSHSSGEGALTRHQGEGPGWLWGYVDPSWLEGFNPGKRVTTIEGGAANEGGGYLRNMRDLLGNPGNSLIRDLLGEMIPNPTLPLPLPPPDDTGPWPPPPI